MSALQPQAKILIISLAGIGDVLLATPLMRSLRAQLPEATIDVLVFWPGAKDLLEGNPHVNTVFQRNLIQQSHAGNLRFFWQLRARRYDVSINTHPQGKIQYRVIARLINATWRLSHRYENYSLLDRRLVNLTLEQGYGAHCIDNNLNLLGLLGLPVPEMMDSELFFSAAELDWAEGVARQHELAGRTVVGLHVGSGKTKNLVLKRWPTGHWVALTRQLLAAHPAVTVLLFGGPEERADNEALVREVNSDRLLPVPSRTLRQAAALLRHCDLFVSVDNAFMHLAATVKVPQQIVIESPTFNRTIWPYHRPFRLVKNPMVAGRNLEYYRYDGRHIRGGRAHLLACMRSVTPEAVFAEVRQALKATAAKA